MTARRTLISLGAIAFLAAFNASITVDGQGARERLLIRGAKPYQSLEAAVIQAGGTVTYKFVNVDAIAAEVPASRLQHLRNQLPALSVSKDEMVALPGSTRDIEGRPLHLDDADVASAEGEALSEADIATLAEDNPSAYLVNNGITGVSALHAAGAAGQGVIVGVIDSGIRPGFPHLSLDGSVIGCEDFVNDALGCSHFGNNGHGTFVAGMISANVAFTFGAASPIRNAVLAHAPGAFANPPANTVIPMFGSAPLSSIYAFRVFGATGGAPTSRILQAMDRVIELREQYDAGLGGQNIRVVNMSIGGSTLYAGRDLFDTMLDRFIDVDIVPVVAASNTGPSLLTTGSPASAFSALTVGAASMVHNERILRDAQFGPGIGVLYRPFSGHQTAYFSSRGPNADGRPDPDVMATGFANYGQGTGATVGSVTLGSGTSYASPSVAGIAAVLRQVFPNASAVQIRNAIIAGANNGVITDGSSTYDQGAGMVNAVAAANLLASGNVADTLEKPNKPKKKVEQNLWKYADLDVVSGNVSVNSGALLPGQQHTILYDVPPSTAQVTVTLANFQQTGPGNALFGDDIILAVHTAKTSSIGETGDYPVFTFTKGGTFVITDPEPGIMRVTLYGDWTNSGPVSVDAAVSSTRGTRAKHSATGDITNGESESFVTTVPPGTAKLEFLLQWRQDWGSYPAADLDLILINPANVPSFAGATADSPERVTIEKPAAGTWTVVVDGFEVHRRKANYTLTMIRDGVVVKLK